MIKDYSYAREKLFEAVRMLAAGQKDVRSRLISAYLRCHTLRVENFPKTLQKDWKWIVKQLTKRGHALNWKGEIWYGSVENTMSNIKNSTGSKIAKKIFDLYCELNKKEYF